MAINYKTEWSQRKYFIFYICRCIIWHICNDHLASCFWVILKEVYRVKSVGQCYLKMNESSLCLLSCLKFKIMHLYFLFNPLPIKMLLSFIVSSQISSLSPSCEYPYYKWILTLELYSKFIPDVYIWKN